MTDNSVSSWPKGSETMNQFLLDLWDYSILYPAALLCILPVLSHCRLSIKKLIPVMFSGILAMILIMAWVRSKIEIDPNIPLAFSLIVSFIFYFAVFNTNKTKLLYIFISAIAVFSFGGLSTPILMAVIDNPNEIIIAYSANWIISLSFLVAEIIFIDKLRWLFDNDTSNNIWKFVWVIPLIISAANIIMIPANEANVRVGRVFQLYVIMECILAVFYIIFLVTQYNIARVITNKAETEQTAHILSLQSVQYKNLKNYMDNTSRLRHDMRYVVKTAQTLAHSGETEKLKELLDTYGDKVDSNAPPAYYCENIALNAITAYYDSEAEKLGIKLSAKLNVPNDLFVTDSELCSIVGNILDNAVTAASESDQKKKRILFVADTKPNNDLFIAVSNPYSGTIRKKGMRFFSTKPNGHGIGLQSVQAIVNKNKGYCNFRYDESNFYSEIMLRQITRE